MAAQVGTIVQVRYCLPRGLPPAVDDLLLSPGGAYYRVLDVAAFDGDGAVFLLRAVKLGAGVEPNGARVLPLEPR